MALNIKSDEAHRLAKELAEARGSTLTDVVTEALREQVATQDVAGTDTALLLASVQDIQRFVAALPDRDSRTPEEILGYDDLGLPG